jgi:probable HAF family extracellular repeat protein
MHILKCAAGAATALLAAAAFGQPVPAYTLELVQGLPGKPAGYITAFNDNGQATGSLTVVDSQGSTLSHAARWDFTTGTVTDLSTADNTTSGGLGINNAGQVVGYTRVTGGYSRATVWTGTTPLDIGIEGAAYGINDAGQIGGTTSASRAFVWNDGTTTDLGTLGGNSSNGRAINSAGQVTGNAQDADGNLHIVRWTGTTIEDLTPQLASSQTLTYLGLGINASGHVAGFAAGPASIPMRAILATDGAAAILPIPKGFGSYAYGLNDAGVVVGSAGRSPASGGTGLVWVNGRAITLNSLLAPGQLPIGGNVVNGVAIGNNGWISCLVVLSPGQAAPCLMKPAR